MERTRAALEEIEADGPTGHWEGLTLFLYNAKTHQWSLNFANSSDGMFTEPAVGEFNGGRGEFYDQEQFNGRAIFVRIVWSNIRVNSHRFEQSFSADGGKTWEPNFIAVLTRRDDVRPASHPPKMEPGQHDFDWELGAWKDHVSRLQQPLEDSNSWMEMNGSVVVSKVWDGRANLAEIKLNGPSGRLEFLSLRLYNSKSRQWTLNFATNGVGSLSVPMAGEFKGGRGQFYDQETFKGKKILVRFLFLPISADSGRSEQAFSDDGGKTWQTNWVNTYTRVRTGKTE